MSISISRYVDITSAVGGGEVVAARSLAGRLFTDNPLIPVGKFITFSNASDVSSFFGSSSEEAARAAFYFSWVSKSATQPQSIQYARFAQSANEARIYGMSGLTSTVAQWEVITNGAFSLTIGDTTNVIGSLDFDGVVSYDAIAAIIQTAVRTKSGDQWTAAVVTYNATESRFEFVSGDDVNAAISVDVAGSGTEIAGADYLGWLPEGVFSQSGTLSEGAIWSAGTAGEDIEDALANSVDWSNNFGSFLFLDDLSLSNDDIKDAAAWNAAQNVAYLYTVGVASANVTALTTAVSSYPGIALTVSNESDEYPEQAPMMIAAATDYESANSVQNYMFQIFPGLTPSITSNSAADNLDALNVNYYGSTQQAGQIINFYQRGVLQGFSNPANISDMTAYVNEIWFKDAALVALMNLLVGLTQLPANLEGRGLVLTTLQDVINRALNNGTISVGKILNSTQKAFVTQETGDNSAWQQVQSSGYWFDAVVRQITGSSPVEYEIVYEIIYAKDDTIKKIEGRHLLV